MDFHTILIIFLFFILFFAGTALLIKKKVQKYFGIIFLIRTRYGIKFIERLSKLPGWKFVADFAIVASLSGIGALYLSSQKRTKNLPVIFLIFGLFACFLNFHTIELFIAGLIFVLLFVIVIKKFPNPYFVFIVFSILIFTITVNGYLILFPHAYMEVLTSLPMSILTSIFGLPAFIIIALMIHAYEIIFLHSEIPGVSPMLPSVKNGEIGFGFLGYNGIFIPIGYGIIALIILLTSHEISHGILSYVHKIKLKSTGLLTFGIIPIGAFVEPDEEKMKKEEGYKRMHIYVMGSFANFIVAIIGVLLITMLVSAAYNPDNGILVTGVINNSPAYGVLSEGMIIHKIDNKSPWKVLQNLSPNKTTILETNEGNKTIITGQHPTIKGRGYIGITYSVPINKGLEGFKDFIHILLELLKWIVLLNFLVGVTNLMPISPFDGGKMIEEIIASFNLNKKVVERIILTIIGLVLFLIIINAFPILNIFSNF